MKKAAIIIVVYNTAEFIVKQVECIRKFCKENPDIIVVDNSDKPEVTEAILYRIQDLNCIYKKTTAHSGNPSLSHAFAANFAYHLYYPEYEYIFMLDHDAFPIKHFSIEELMQGKIVAGMTQTRKTGKTYFWPGCLIIKSSELGGYHIDFSPNQEYGLDTGGNLYKLFEAYDHKHFLFFDEHAHENVHHKKLHQNAYSIIGELFMHFIAGSNWNNLPQEDYNARISGLMATLNERIGGSNG